MAEMERASELERRSAESEAEVRGLQQAVTEGRKNRQEMLEFWKTSIEREVAAAKATGLKKGKARVEATTIRRMRSLSVEVSLLRQKVIDLQAENERLQETLLSRPPTRRFPAEGAMNSTGLSRLQESRSKCGDHVEALTAAVASEWHPSNCQDALTVPTVAAALDDDTLGTGRDHARLDQRRYSCPGKPLPLLIGENHRRATAGGYPQEATRDGDLGIRPPSPLPQRWREFVDRPPDNDRVSCPSFRRATISLGCVSAERSSDHGGRGISDDGSAPGALGHETEALENIFGAPAGCADSSSELPSRATAQQYTGGSGSRKRGLGILPRWTSTRRRSRMIAADSCDVDAGLSIALASEGGALAASTGCEFGESLVLEDSKRSDAILAACLAVEANAACGSVSEWQRFSMGGDSPSLSLTELITSGEFYPGGVSGTKQGGAGVSRNPGPDPEGDSSGNAGGNIGLTDHNEQSLDFAEDTDVDEEANEELGHGTMKASRGAGGNDYRSSTIFATAPAAQAKVRSVRGDDTSVTPRAAGTTANLRQTFDRHMERSQRSASFGGAVGRGRISERDLRDRRRSLAESCLALALDGRGSTSDCGGEPQKSLDDFLRDLSVTGGDVAGGGRDRGLLGLEERDSLILRERTEKRWEAEDGSDIVV